MRGVVADRLLWGFKSNWLGSKRLKQLKQTKNFCFYSLSILTLFTVNWGHKRAALSRSGGSERHRYGLVQDV